jgi:hypothetical protein
MLMRHAVLAAAVLGSFIPALAQDNPLPLNPPLRATGAYPVRQDPSQWLGSNLIGAKVVSSTNERIGRIANLIVNDDGAVEAAVISVGGVFGVGNKEVAVTYKSLNIVRNKTGDAIDRVMLAATKKDLLQAATFQPLTQRNVSLKR